METGPRPPGKARDPSLPDLLPFRRARDLLQYFPGSLIGTPDLVRDVGAPNRRELLGGLKALRVLGLVEVGKLDPQTVAWRWIAGHGESRTYIRGYFRRAEAPISIDEEAEASHAGSSRWPWLDQTVYREWQLGDQAGAFVAVAENDGMPRYRAPTPDGLAVQELIKGELAAMPRLEATVLGLTLLRGLSPEEAAQVLDVSVSSARRRSERGLEPLRVALAAAGYAPPAATNHPVTEAGRARAA